MAAYTPEEQSRLTETSIQKSIRDTRMELKQIFIFLLNLACCVAIFNCIDEKDLQNKAIKKLKRFHSYPIALTHTSDNLSCPLEQFSDKLEDRSLSPWSYKKVDLPDHFPNIYYEAYCLCKGCIVEGKNGPEENHNYNSVPIIHSRLFFKKERCENDTKPYHLRPVKIEIQVGCTCARPK